MDRTELAKILRIGRVYDPGHAERALGFRCETDFARILESLRTGAPLPFTHDPDYVGPITLRRS